MTTENPALTMIRSLKHRVALLHKQNATLIDANNRLKTETACLKAVLERVQTSRLPLTESTLADALFSDDEEPTTNMAAH